MDQPVIRSLTSQLAEDLAWLEEHCRTQKDQANQAGALHLAAAMVRNVIGPFLEGQPAVPLHLAVVGGAGAGKSTIANMASGSVLAETNPQAGFTRHPIAYTSSNGQISWPAHLGFLGNLHRLSKPSPASLDEDVYQVRRVPVEPNIFSLLDHFVVWDCPDMTTWAATNYVPRLLEVAGLADVLVYVASDERYNDEVPTQFLRLLLQAGKMVVVCLVKMREADAPAFVAHFQKEVLSKMPAAPVACLTVPHLTHAQLADPVKQAPQYRIPLVNQLAVLGSNPAETRKRNAKSAMNYLRDQQNSLLGVARNDLAVLQGWRNLVMQGQVEFEGRYRREFLSSERFRRFDEALVRLLDLLELPGLGKVLSTTLMVLRTPYRLLKGLFTKTMQRPEAASMPEKPVLEGSLAGWMDMLRKEAARRTSTHPVWAYLDKGFAAGLADQTRERFEQGFRAFQLGMADEVDRTAKAIYEELEKNPVALNTLRGSKFALEVAAITSTLIAGGLTLLDFVLVPLAASVTHQLVELLGKQYVESQRELARARQEAMVRQHLSGPLAEWLTQWPTTGGSTFERLQIILRRVPAAIQQLDGLVREGSKG
jgi:hypothetical protein